MEVLVDANAWRRKEAKPDLHFNLFISEVDRQDGSKTPKPSSTTMGKPSTEFDKLEQLLLQTADEVAQCLRGLKTNLTEYDARHGLLFLNTSKSYMRKSIRAAKDVASELRHVADEISRSETPTESEVAAARGKIHAVSDALLGLKKNARAYDHKNNLDDGSDAGRASEMSMSSFNTESEGSYSEDSRGKGSLQHSKSDVAKADTVETVVRLTLRDGFSGFSAVKHQISRAEDSLSPSFAEHVMETVNNMTNSLKTMTSTGSEAGPKRTMSV